MNVLAHVQRDQCYSHLVRRAIAAGKARLAVWLIYRREREYLRAERRVRAYIAQL